MYSIVVGRFKNPQPLRVEASVGFLDLVFRINWLHLFIEGNRSAEDRSFYDVQIGLMLGVSLLRSMFVVKIQEVCLLRLEVAVEGIQDKSEG